ncbi:CynX/NimT family MFS transporter [Streptomyces sp. 7-21]|uniref:CynX/NimT family MFS transporter n=1 Tax=Streptomyces sp. 7-21 TaxID=2802283 RepID=UPI0035A8EC9D
MAPMAVAKHDRTRSGSSTPLPPRARAVWGPWLILAGLVLAALNLRPAIASLGPMLEEVRADLGMSGTTAGLLTSVPPLCFGVFGLTAPRLTRRLGPVAVMLGAMAAICGGLVLRSVAGGVPVFLAATAVALAGIAIGNVLMPVLVKRYFPDRMGPVTSVYSTGFAVGTSAAAALTIPLAGLFGGGWRAGLGLWAGVAALGVLPWLAALLQGRREPAAPAAPDGPAAAAAAAAAGPAPRPSRSPTAWWLALFFGLQSTSAYVIMGWLPQIFRDAGVPATSAGVMLAVAMGVSVPLSLVLPQAAARMRRQGPLVALLGVFALAGYAGLWVAPEGGAWVWSVFLGIANCAFPVALTMIGLRARTSAGVARLSAFAQSTGYLLCVPGPVLVGMLNEATGGWHAPLALMTALTVAQIAAGVLAGRDRYLEDEAAAVPAPGR